MCATSSECDGRRVNEILKYSPRRQNNLSPRRRDINAKVEGTLQNGGAPRCRPTYSMFSSILTNQCSTRFKCIYIDLYSTSRMELRKSERCTCFVGCNSCCIHYKNARGCSCNYANLQAQTHPDPMFTNNGEHVDCTIFWWSMHPPPCRSTYYIKAFLLGQIDPPCSWFWIRPR